MIKHLKEVAYELEDLNDEELDQIKTDASVMTSDDFFSKHPELVGVIIAILSFIKFLPFTGRVLDIALDALLQLLSQYKKPTQND